MHDEEIKTVAAELATAREGKPSLPGAARKRIRYASESIQKATRLFYGSGETPAAFARRLGVSEAAMTRWIADAADDATFISVRIAGERPADEAPAAVTATREAPAPVATAAPEEPRLAETRRAAPPTTSVVLVRETVVSIPADLDLGRVREIMMAMRGGAPC